MPSRREYLAAVTVGLAAFAGCQSDSAEPASPTTTTIRATATPTTTASPSMNDEVSVTDVVVRKAVTYESAMGSGGVLADDDRQYVVAGVRSTRNLSASSFAFAPDEESWTPGLPDTAGGVNRTVAGRGGGPVGQPIGAENGSYLAFTVPSPMSGSNPRIEFGTSDPVTWPLPSTARDTLGAPSPEFELRSLDVPRRATRGDPLTVSLTVENVSDSDGRFLAAAYWPTTLADDNEAHVIERTAAAGETVTASLEVDTDYAPDDEPVTLRVRGHVTAEREVDLRS
jgi:hypothetical protein